MDASDRTSPRSRQLQGPRPPRLAVSKDSHKVRKPPVAPQRHHHLQPAPQQHKYQPQQQQARAPVIIYDASPKVIHTKPGDFLALVQRLTGPGAGASAAQDQFDEAAGAGPSAAQPMEYQPRELRLSPTAALSPAARLASIERSVRPLPPAPSYVADDYSTSFADVDSFAAVLGPPGRPGILSPATLPPVASTGLFSPLPFDPSCLSWLGDLSPFLPSASARAAGLEPPFAPSPRSSLLLATPTMPSPATFSVLEFFSNFPDL
ncbi:protein MKS1-like [Phragmites australis]|uniref:protein MKS1-like n=1 Tax=Phragmites australis TaxID=29695 RepID=UPI002D772847|nr:protein MKS1-like [Phragmites australis]